MALGPVSEDDLALLQRLYSDPLVSGEHEWHGWQDTRWLRREWEENGLPGERALEKAGFTREGVLRGALFRRGQWHDCVFYGILRDDVDLDGGEAASATPGIDYVTPG